MLNAADAPNTYSYELKLDNLNYDVKADGSIEFKYADSDRFAFKIPKPFMYEAGDMPQISDKVTQAIRQDGNKIYLDITADPNWLKEQGRKFPVIIDPTINSEQITMNDTFVSELNPTTDYSQYDHVYAGNTSSYGKTEAYLRFPLPGLPDGAKITNSTVKIYNYLTKTTTTNLDVYQITSSWDESTVNWNNKPQKGQIEASYSSSSAGWHYITLTNLTSDWYTGHTPNNGIAIVANPDTSEPVGYTSSNYTTDTNYRPKMIIDYVIDPEGINNFWTYTSDGVMPFKGNLFLMTTDLATSGRGVDAVISRSYNSRQTVASGVFGSGWLSNIDMRVWDLDGSVAFLDAAGTRHIFDWNTALGQYDPPAGISLSLTRDDINGIFKIKTTDNIVFYFDMSTGKLTKIVEYDNQISNKQETTYTTEPATGDLLITDPSGRITRIHFLVDGKVDYALDPKGRKAQYTYNTSGLLKDVTISSGTESITYSYTYVTGTFLLDTITDPKGNTVTYSYDAYNRIQSVTQQIDGKVSTNNYNINSGVTPREATVTGMNNEQIIYYTNDNANVVQTDVTLNATDTATTVYSWSANNYLYQIDQPNTQTTKIEYGNNGEPIKITTPDNNDVRTNYDPNNNLISSKDRLNNAEGTNYNSYNNPTDITDATGNTTMLDYADNGNLLSATGAMSLAENYVYNSGFEINSSPAGWNASRTVITGDIYDVDGTIKAKGYQSFHIKSVDANGLYGIMNYKVPVSPQMIYNLSADIKLGSNSTTEMKVIWYDSTDTIISEINGLSKSTAGSYGTDWHHKSTGITAPAGAVKAEIQVGVIGIGEAWFDDIVFEGGTGRTGNILMTNQSFDYDLDQTGLADEWYPGPVSTDISIDYNNHKHGIASEKIIGDINNYKYVGQTLALSGPKGTKFNLSGWGKHTNVPSTGGEWGLKLKFVNTSSGIEDWHYIPFDRNLTDWQQISRVIEAGIDFDKVEVYAVFNFIPVTATAWFDDAQLNVVNVPSSTISQYNYADNSSFEYDYNSTNWPDGWYKSSGDGNFTGQWVDLTSSNGNVYTGSHAIKISNPTSWVSATRTDEKVPFDSAKSYTAVGYIKTIDVNSSAVILIHAYNQNDTWLGEVASKTVTGTSDWTRVSAIANSANLPVGTVKLAVGVQMRTGTGTSYFDNVRFQEGEFRTQFAYDSVGNYVNSITSPSGNTITLNPESTTGNLLSFTDTLGNTFSADYNMMDQMTTFTYPFQGALGLTPVNKSYTYIYDNNGNLTSVTDPNANTWATFQYNELNQIKQFDETVTTAGTPSTNTSDYSYDTSGRLDKVTLPTGQFSNLGYDYAGRLTSLAYGNGTTPTKTYSYGYDLNNNLTNFGDGTNTFTATYDNMNRVTKVTEPNVANFIENSYDAEGKRTSLTVTNGTNIWNDDYTYDSSGNPQQFTDSVTGKHSWYLFDESGKPVKEYHSNDTGTYFEYDQEGRIIQLRIEKAGETIDKLRYVYDSNGNITKIWSDMDSSWVEYTYDSLGQLLQENYSNGTTNEYQYDELGNRTKVINNSGTTNYTYNTEKNRLVSVGSNNYTYDANGNVTSDGTYTYIWGDDNKLKEVKQGITTIASFTYDALGRRETMTDTNGVTKTFHYDGDQVTYVTQSDGKIYRFAYDHSGKPIFMSYNNNQYWYHYDQHGNVIRMTDVNGATVAQYQYDAWGNITYPLGTGIEIQDLNPYRYAGYWYDRDIDKYYLKARYYDASIGRFLSKDPLEVRVGDSLSLNAYTYGENNPVMMVDPSGLVAEMMSGGGYEYSGKKDPIIIMSQNIDIGQGWTARKDKANPSKGTKKHMHVDSPRGKKWAQNDKGSLRHGTGRPPKKVLKRLKEKTGWDWEKREKAYDQKNKISGNDVLVGAGVVGGGYIIYRGIRMLPSLLPPLWPTIPANLIVP